MHFTTQLFAKKLREDMERELVLARIFRHENARRTVRRFAGKDVYATSTVSVRRPVVTW